MNLIIQEKYFIYDCKKRLFLNPAAFQCREISPMRDGKCNLSSSYFSYIFYVIHYANAGHAVFENGIQLVMLILS